MRLHLFHLTKNCYLTRQKTALLSPQYLGPGSIEIYSIYIKCIQSPGASAELRSPVHRWFLIKGEIFLLSRKGQSCPQVGPTPNRFLTFDSKSPKLPQFAPFLTYLLPRSFGV